MLHPLTTRSQSTQDGNEIGSASADAVRREIAADRKLTNVVLVGLGGYAAELCSLLEAENHHPLSTTRLHGLFVIDPENHRQRLGQLRGDGAQVYDDFEQVLDDDSVDAVWLPVPIHLHVPLASQALRAGKTVMLEKPVAGSLADHLELAEVQKQTRQTLLIGFQDIYPPGTARLKRLLLEGAFGQPLRAVVHGCWPRSDAYYSRNNWAGRRESSGVAINDSPLSNAMAHFVNLALFLLGNRFDDPVQIQQVTGQLWRTRPIENFDTCSLRVNGQRGSAPVDLIVLLTHAAQQESEPCVEIDTERGTLRWSFDGRTTFRSAETGEVSEVTGTVVPRPHMARKLGAVALGAVETGPGATATLANSLSHTQLIEAAQRATSIIDVPESMQQVPEDVVMEPRGIRGIEQWFARAAAARQALHEHGCDLPGQPGTFNDLRSLTHGNGTR